MPVLAAITVLVPGDAQAHSYRNVPILVDDYGLPGSTTILPGCLAKIHLRGYNWPTTSPRWIGKPLTFKVRVSVIAGPLGYEQEYVQNVLISKIPYAKWKSTRVAFGMDHMPAGSDFSTCHATGRVVAVRYIFGVYQRVLRHEFADKVVRMVT